MPSNEDSEQPKIAIPQEEFNAAVSPSNLRGRINLRLEQALQSEIESIADDVRFPLNSVSEVVRYCCLLGIERLRAWQPEGTLLGSIKAANALMVRDKMQCESLELLQRLDERVDWYISNGFFDRVIDLVGEVRTYFDNQESDFWSVYIQKGIDTRFQAWLDRIDKVRCP